MLDKLASSSHALVLSMLPGSIANNARTPRALTITLGPD